MLHPSHNDTNQGSDSADHGAKNQGPRVVGQGSNQGAEKEAAVTAAVPVSAEVLGAVSVHRGEVPCAHSVGGCELGVRRDQESTPQVHEQDHQQGHRHHPLIVPLQTEGIRNHLPVLLLLTEDRRVPHRKLDIRPCRCLRLVALEASRHHQDSHERERKNSPKLARSGYERLQQCSLDINQEQTGGLQHGCGNSQTLQTAQQDEHDNAIQHPNTNAEDVSPGFVDIRFLFKLRCIRPSRPASHSQASNNDEDGQQNK
mmetsp:Transcript_5068/g.11855  ORF Transcript_5068/g.11855 Transcript_5068/m.11855 type:complete len:257 (-) Transcript_5068:632-1402(-)